DDRGQNIFGSQFYHGAASCDSYSETRRGGARRSSLRPPRPHPAVVIFAVAAKPFDAGGRDARDLEILQPELADFERFGVAVGKPAVATLQMAAHGTLRIVVVPAPVGGHAP